jgi:hypothetical protein
MLGNVEVVLNGNEGHDGIDGDNEAAQVVAAQAGPGSIISGMSQFDERAWMRKLRTFSGRRSPSSGELDYDSWLYQVTQLEEEDVDDRVRCRLVIQSLAQPASGLVRSLGRNVTLAKIVNVIRTVYGSLSDGHSLLMAVYDAVQGREELPSKYLQRLQSLLRKAVDAGGLSEEAEFMTLSKQFSRGCDDEQLLQVLGLPTDVAKYHDFCDLLMAVAQEERRREEKDERIGRARETKATPKAGGRSNNVGARSATSVASDVSDATNLLSAFDTHTKAVLEEVRALKLDRQAQADRGSDPAVMAKSFAKPAARENKVQRPEARGGHYFCYRCGLNNHMSFECKNVPNAPLVQERLLRRPGVSGFRGTGQGNGGAPGSGGQTQGRIG